MSVVVRADVLLAAIRKVKHAAASYDDGRPILASILLETDRDGSRLVAADNYRIAIAELELEGDAKALNNPILSIYELLVLEPFLKLSKGLPITIERIEPRYLTLSCGLRQVRVTLVDGSYPQYRKVTDLVAARKAARTQIVGVNSKYLADLHAAGAGGEAGFLRILVGEPNEPIALTSDGYAEYIMPVRTAT